MCVFMCCSNFWPCEVVLDGLGSYSSGEHAFHGAKLKILAEHAFEAGDSRRGDELTAHAVKFEVGAGQLRSPLDAKRAGGKRGLLLEASELQVWNRRSEEVQLEICRYKLCHHAEVQGVLKASGSRMLLHQENRAQQSTPWGGRIDKVTGRLIGQNKLGKVWQRLRDGESELVVPPEIPVGRGANATEEPPAKKLKCSKSR